MSALIEGHRIRATRLLRGEFQTDYLTQLFLYLRDRCDGREPVQEVGDFVAHQEKRTKGLLTRSYRDFFLFVRLRLTDVEVPVDYKALPEYFPQFIDAAMRRIKPEDLKELAGLNKTRAAATIPGIKAALKPNPDGTLRLGPVRPDEAAVLRCIMSVLRVDPIFTGERLFKDFRDSLVQRSILRPPEAKEFADVAPMVMLFAATVMNNSVLLLDENSRAELFLHIGDTTTPTGIGIAARSPDLPKMNLITQIYSTNLKAEDYCEPDLLELLKGQYRGFNTEITHNRRLGVMR